MTTALSPTVEYDLHDEHPLIYRFTSGTIEADYRENGDPNAEHKSHTAYLCDLLINIVIDADNHLTLFCRSLSNTTAEHISLTNGTEHSPICDIEINA